METDIIDTGEAFDQQSDINENCCNSPDDQFDENNYDEQNRNILPNISEMKKRVLEGQNLAFFHSGCFAPKEERLSQTGSNYTCAIDTLIALGEAILISGNDKSVAHAISFSPLLLEIKSVLVWRLENEFHESQLVTPCQFFRLNLNIRFINSKSFAQFNVRNEKCKFCIKIE